MSRQTNKRRELDNEAKVVLKNIRVSPQKLNLVAQMIRKETASKAISILQFSKRRISSVVEKALSREQDNSDNLLIFNIADKRPISTNDLVKAFHKKMKSHVIYIRIPKSIEILISKMPIIKKIYFNLTNNFSLNVSRFEKRYNCSLLDTKNSIELWM